MIRYLWLPEDIPEDFFPPEISSQIAALHREVRSGVYGVVTLKDANEAYINVLWREPVPKVTNPVLYHAFDSLVLKADVPEKELLKYIQEEFATQYERCMLYAQQEWASMFDKDSISMLARVLAKIKETAGEFSEFTVRYRRWNDTYGYYTTLMSDAEPDFNPRALIWAFRHIREAHLTEDISIESIYLE